MEPIPEDLLEILVCPETHQPVRPAPDELVERLKRLQNEGRLKNRAGATPEDPIDGALVREDRQVAYLVCEGIPIMLIDEAIALDALPA
jgi:uncharacterized protein YbaR (Trm112 family)